MICTLLERRKTTANQRGSTVTAAACLLMFTSLTVNGDEWKKGKQYRAMTCIVYIFVCFLWVSMGWREPRSAGDIIVMCSFMTKRICFSSLLRSHILFFSRFMVVCVSSPPCSPCKARPNLFLWRNGKQCTSSRCCFGVTSMFENYDWKNVM